MLVTGCTHPIKLAGAKTAKGIINTNEAQLGYVCLWNKNVLATSYKMLIDQSLFPQTSPTPTTSDLIAFTQAASLVGEASLSAVDKAVLEGEAAARSSIDTKNFTTMGLADSLTALNDSIRANPKEWYKPLELNPANDRFEHE